MILFQSIVQHVYIKTDGEIMSNIYLGFATSLIIISTIRTLMTLSYRWMNAYFEDVHNFLDSGDQKSLPIYVLYIRKKGFIESFKFHNPTLIGRR